MFERIKEFFTNKDFYRGKETTDIDGYKIMTSDEIAKDNEAFNEIGCVIRYLYTKDKERENINQIGYVGNNLDKQKRGC